MLNESAGAFEIDVRFQKVRHKVHRGLRTKFTGDSENVFDASLMPSVHSVAKFYEQRDRC
jgi:hypothetical protein